MKRKHLYSLLSLMVLLSMLLAACQLVSTEAPQMTEAPTAAAPATEVPAGPGTERRGGWLDEIDVSVVAGESAISQLQAGAIDLYSFGLAVVEGAGVSVGEGKDVFVGSGCIPAPEPLCMISSRTAIRKCQRMVVRTVKFLL